MEKSAGVIPNLNGMRAVAVAMVVMGHSGAGHYIPGRFGVTVFFVLSGFLITTLLLQEHDRTGTISLSKFYLRRLLRLTPPLYVVTALGVAAVELDWVGGGDEPLGITSLLLYFANYYLVFDGSNGIPDGLVVSWSLAVEEHFYLLWPPVLLWLFRSRLDRDRLGWLLIAASVAVLGWRLVLDTMLGASDLYILEATDARIDSLMAGCWLALVRNPWLTPPTTVQRGRETLLLLVCGLLILLTPLVGDPLFRNTLRGTLQNWALVGVFWLVVARADRWPFRMLGHPVADYVGRVSYSLYLSHFLLIHISIHILPDQPLLLTIPVGILLSFAFAEAMRRWVEDPLSRVRARLSSSHAAQRPLKPIEETSISS
ncbi:MAG: acyltransferase family protein [Panacagrimonas sp.]